MTGSTINEFARVIYESALRWQQLDEEMTGSTAQEQLFRQNQNAKLLSPLLHSIDRPFHIISK
jgi:hypothetical protein